MVRILAGPPAVADALHAPPVLEVEGLPWAGVGCWTSAQSFLARARVVYLTRYPDLRCRLGVAVSMSQATFLAITEELAGHADFRTGRNVRVSNETVAARVGCCARTVSRARLLLKLLRLGTEVLRGRQRTRAERIGSSWPAKDKNRGWASVWALHPPPPPHPVDNHGPGAAGHEGFSTHPRRGCLSTGCPLEDGGSTGGAVDKQAPSARFLPEGRHRAGPEPGRGGGLRATGPASASGGAGVGGLALARAWRADPDTPAWGRRHTPAAWARVLAAPAAAGWDSDDLNQALRDWAGAGRWVPDSPHRPIGLLGAVLKAADLGERPAWADKMREQHAAHAAAARAQASRTLAACPYCDDHGWALPHGDTARRCGRH